MFETTKKGYDRLWNGQISTPRPPPRVWSVEGTGSYGAGVTSYLTARG